MQRRATPGARVSATRGMRKRKPSCLMIWKGPADFGMKACILLKSCGAHISRQRPQCFSFKIPCLFLLEDLDDDGEEAMSFWRSLVAGPRGFPGNTGHESRTIPLVSILVQSIPKKKKKSIGIDAALLQSTLSPLRKNCLGTLWRPEVHLRTEIHPLMKTK